MKELWNRMRNLDRGEIPLLVAVPADFLKSFIETDPLYVSVEFDSLETAV